MYLVLLWEHKYPFLLFMLCNEPTNAHKLNMVYHNYHSPTCFGCVSDLHQGVVQDYEQYSKDFTKICV